MSYFKTDDFLGESFVYFGEQPIPSSRSPECFDVLRELSMTSASFAERANAMFEEYSIRVPRNYPKESNVKRALFDESLRMVPWNDFAICVGCCILMKEEFGIDVSRIIKDELLENNSRSGILHATAMATIALHYLRDGLKVSIPREQVNTYNPDLVIGDLSCEVKAIDESDWTRDIDPSTGKGKQYSLSEDICYDLGQFISKRDSGHKGIKQSEVIFADLSLKSLGWIHECGWITKNNPGMPALQKHRIIYFAREIIHFNGFYIDLDPRLWELIATTKTKHSFAVFGART